jgi:hypothetical protein
MSIDITLRAVISLSIFTGYQNESNKKKRPARTIELHLRLSYKPPKMSLIFISLFLSLSACWRLCAGQFHHPKHFDAVNDQF